MTPSTETQRPVLWADILDALEKSKDTGSLPGMMPYLFLQALADRFREYTPATPAPAETTAQCEHPWFKSETRLGNEKWCQACDQKVSGPQPVSEPADRSDVSMKLSDAQIKHMVDRFLDWKLPENFNPDGGITFKAMFNEHTPHPMKHEPSGTNLFDAAQADAMVRYMLAEAPEPLSLHERANRELLTPESQAANRVPMGASPAPVPLPTPPDAAQPMPRPPGCPPHVWEKMCEYDAAHVGLSPLKLAYFAGWKYAAKDSEENARPPTPDAAQGKPKCETCGGKISSYRNGCPLCSAPNCCETCCRNSHTTTGESGLRECPFCGSSEHVKTRPIRDGREAHCFDCGATGAPAFHGPTAMLPANARAIAAWNRRSSPSSAWRDIKDAPKDGTVIIGGYFDVPWAESHMKGRVVKCWYQPEFSAFISSCREMSLATGYTFKDGSTKELHSPEIETVSHFMPYSEPPK